MIKSDGVARTYKGERIVDARELLEIDVQCTDPAV